MTGRSQGNLFGIINAMSRKSIKNIMVVIPTGDYAERLKLNGILEYARDKVGSRWNLKLCVGGHVRLPSPETCRTRYDGIIAYVQSESERRELLRISRPIVLIEDISAPTRPLRRNGVASIICDHVAEGQTAAKYFMSRNFRNFAFVGTVDKTPWSEMRLYGFSSALRKEGYQCAAFNGKSDLGTWLKSLPKPCALFAVRDMRAREVLDAADEHDVSVPDEMAILGVDNDEILCTTARPHLSSIPSFDRSLGYAAGRTLNALMAGRSKGGLIRTRHASVVTRQSTETDAIDDPFVRNALKWIRANLSSPLNAESISRAIGYSSIALQRRFAQTLGATISETVRHARLTAAREMLKGSSASIDEIAFRCGYSCTSHLCVRMREAEGVTPLVYRRAHSYLWPVDQPRPSVSGRLQ